MFTGWWSPPDPAGGIALGELPASGEANAWQGAAFNDLIWLATGVAAIALGAATATQPRPNLPVVLSAVVVALGLLSLVLVIVRLIDPPEALGVPRGRELGAWLGLVAILGIVYGGWTAMRDEGANPPAADSMR